MAQTEVGTGAPIYGIVKEWIFDINTETLAGAMTLTISSLPVQFLDPGGAGRTVTLPPEASSTGLAFWIVNTADAAETITVEDDGTTTISTIAQNEAALLVCNGTVWKTLVGGIT